MLKAAGIALLGLLFAAASPATAEVWPARAVKIIVPFAPGSTPDALARILADRLQAKLGQPFVVENKPGAGGNLGTDAVAKAEPDGHTVGISILGPLALNTLLFKSLPYDPAKDLAHVTLLASQPSVLVASNGLNVGTAEELLALLKREPRRYNFGSVGIGSLSHLSMELIALKTGTRPVHVPYDGSPKVVTALIQGDVHMASLPAGSVVAQAQAGKLKMLAISSARRSSLLPDLPTLKELGIPDVEADAWSGLVAPAKTGDAVVERIREEVVQALADPVVRDKLRAQFTETTGSTSAEFRAFVANELARWTPVIRANNLEAN